MVSLKGRKDITEEAWYSLYKRSKEMLDETGVKSNMIWGCEWDQVMIWFDSQGGEKKEYVYDATGRCVNVPTKLTGSKPEYAVNNIYDMAGNVAEQTMEAYSSSGRIDRGLSMKTSIKNRPSKRGYAESPDEGGQVLSPTSRSNSYGSRVAMII